MVSRVNFFRESWSVLEVYVCHDVKNFFSTGKLLRVINITSITLVPKVSHPFFVTDFRPISCCSVLPKCISKLLCTRIKSFLPDIIYANQGDIVVGRQIVHNILVL